MIGQYKGHFIMRKRICDVLAVSLRSYAYHVWVGTCRDVENEDYLGHFTTLREVYARIDDREVAA